MSYDDKITCLCEATTTKDRPCTKNATHGYGAFCAFHAKTHLLHHRTGMPLNVKVHFRYLNQMAQETVIFMLMHMKRAGVPRDVRDVILSMWIQTGQLPKPGVVRKLAF